MSLDIERIRKIQGTYGSPSHRATEHRRARFQTEKDYGRSLDVKRYYIWDEEVTECDVLLEIVKKKRSSVEQDNTEFRCLSDTKLRTGDILYNETDDTYWLTIFGTDISGLYRTGILYICQNIIKWRDKDGNIWEYPVHNTNTTQYNSGIEPGRNVDYITSQHSLLTRMDKNSLGLRPDNRFFLGQQPAVPNVYKLTSMDTATYNIGTGVIKLTVMQDVYDPMTDHTDTGLCDTHPDIDSFPVSSGGTIELSLNGRPRVIIGGHKTVRANTASDGLIWSIGETELLEFITLNPSADTKSCDIYIPITEEAIEKQGKSFTLKCTGADGAEAYQTLTIIGGV